MGRHTQKAQDHALLAGLVGDRPGADDVTLRHRDGKSYLVVRNEFATVWLGIDRTANGVRLLVTDPGGRTAMALDPLELEAISRMHHRDFDEGILESSRDDALPPDERSPEDL